MYKKQLNQSGGFTFIQRFYSANTWWMVRHINRRKENRQIQINTTSPVQAPPTPKILQ